MNIAEILKNTPRGTKLYSPVFGECELKGIHLYENYPIVVATKNSTYSFTSKGLLYSNERNGECMLFPSRENRDWSTFILNKFDTSSLKPFDKVLVRDGDTDDWYCNFYSHYRNNASYYNHGCISSSSFHQCIPYNDETKHLVGTDKDCPEYYKTW